MDTAFQITKTTRRAAGSGTWATGRIAGFRFEALVFPEHAEVESYELGRSRISKLWVGDGDGHWFFNFDRGPDLEPATPDVAAAVDILCSSLAELVYGD